MWLMYDSNTGEIWETVATFGACILEIAHANAVAVSVWDGVSLACIAVTSL